MRTLLDVDCRTAAERRVAWCFDAARDVVVSWSGGKDSVVIMHLALEEARRRDRLPLKVAWLDQEAEYEAVAELARALAADPEIDFRWYQLPFRLFNSSGFEQHWLHCWGPGEDWMRERDPSAIVDIGRYPALGESAGTARFKRMIDVLWATDFPDAINMVGIRAQESMRRNMSLGVSEGIKCYVQSALDTPMARELDALPRPRQVSPIYDWLTPDVWKAIHDGGWRYCTLYDEMYRMGVPTGQMRISSLCHEMSTLHAVRAQMLEPDTWDRLVRRLPSLNDYKHIHGREIERPSLPSAFRGWEEYREYLLEHIVDSDRERGQFRKMFDHDEPLRALDGSTWNRVLANHVAALIRGDCYGNTSGNAEVKAFAMLAQARMAEEASDG